MPSGKREQVLRVFFKGNLSMSIQHRFPLTYLMYVRDQTNLLADRNNPSFVDSRYGSGLMCYANYPSSVTCVEAVDTMQDWLAKQHWARGIKVHVKKQNLVMRSGKGGAK